jgi:hypothetical protein
LSAPSSEKMKPMRASSECHQTRTCHMICLYHAHGHFSSTFGPIQYVHAEEELEVVVSTSSETLARIRHGGIRDRDRAGGLIIYDPVYDLPEISFRSHSKLSHTIAPRSEGRRITREVKYRKPSPILTYYDRRLSLRRAKKKTQLSCNLVSDKDCGLTQVQQLVCFVLVFTHSIIDTPYNLALSSPLSLPCAHYPAGITH